MLMLAQRSSVGDTHVSGGDQLKYTEKIKISIEPIQNTGTDKAAKENCFSLGGKQDQGFFPLLKNMGLDLKYAIEITERLD